MRILVLTSYVPFPPHSGAKIHVANQMKYLSQNHDVTLMCPVRPNSGQAENAQKLVGEYCTEVKPIPWQKRSKIKYLPHLLRYIRVGDPIGYFIFYHQELADALYHITATEHFDIVNIHHSYMAPYIEAISPQSRCKRIITLHNVPYTQWQRMMTAERNIYKKAILFRDWLFQKHATLKYVRRYDKTVTISELDRSIILKDVPQANIIAITTGLDTRAIAPLSQPATFHNLLFIGSMHYRPNVDAAQFLCQEIFPLIRQRMPETRLFIVGSNPPKGLRQLGKQTDGIMVTGYVDNVIPFYEKSCITLVPLRSGSGIRIKILESLALGRPVVSTTLGCEGLQVTHNQNILISDTATDFATQTVRMMTDPILWQYIASRGRYQIEHVYDLQVVGRRLVQAFNEE